MMGCDAAQSSGAVPRRAITHSKHKTIYNSISNIE